MAVQLAGWAHTYLEALCAQHHFSAARTVAPLWLASDVSHPTEPGAPIAAPLTIQMAAEIFPRLALIGPAGAGKTTTLRALAIGLAEAFLSGNSRAAWSSANAPLPLYIELGRFQGSIEATLAAGFGVGAPPPLDELARERPLLFLLDGLDELPPATQLASLAALTHTLAATGAQTRWISTCRSEHLGLFRPWLNGAEVRTLQPLRPRDVIAQVQRQAGDVAAAWVQRNEDILHLATRPRWLTALIEAREALNAPIQSRGQLLATWMPALVTAALMAHPRSISASQAVHALIDIAQLLDHQGQNDLTFDSAITAIEVSAYVSDAPLMAGALHRSTSMHGRTLRATTGEAALLALIDAGILTCDAERRTIGFRHPVLRSFAQALLLARTRPDQWSSAILSRAWTDAVIFAYSLSDDRDAVVRRLLAAGAVALTARCLIDAEAPAQYDELLERSGSLTPPLRVMIADAFAAEGLDRAALEQLERAGNEGYDEAGLFGRLGDLYSRSGQWRLARVAYEQALAREADDLRYRQQLGVVCSRMGELEQAAAALETVLDAQQKRSAAAAHELGHVYLQQGRFSRALEAYRHATQQQPGEPAYRRSAAMALRRLGRLDEAQAELHDLIAGSGGDAATYAELGEIHADAGRCAEAVESYARAVALRPDDPSLYVRLGQLRRSIGDLPGARAALQRAVELHSSNAALQDELGQVLAACGEMDSALAAYRAAVSLDPQCAAYYRRLGALLRDCGNIDEAAAALRAALELRPESADTYGELAELLWRAGDTEQALDAFRRAYALAPDSPDHARALGRAYSRLGRTRDAERLLREALKLAPERADLHYDYGVAAEAVEQWDTALAAYEQAAALDSQRADYARAAGALLLRRGDLARARSLLAGALRRARHDSETLFQTGMLHAAMGAWRLAARSFQRAARLSSSTRYESALGKAYLHLGMANDACAAFERALLLHPDDTDTLDAYRCALETCGRLEAAYAIGRRVASLAPGNAAIQQRAGSLALRLGRVNEALELLDRAVALDSRLVAAHIERSRALLTTGRAEAALAAAQQALTLTSDRAHPATLAAEALIALRRDDEARPLLEQALALDATLLPACVALRDLLARAGDLAGAVSLAQRTVELAPNDAAHHTRLGELLLEAGNLAQAEQALQHALHLVNDADGAEERNQRIARIYELLCRARIRASDWEQAVSHARACVDCAPGNSTYRALLADALEGSGNLAAAVAELESAAAAEPDRVDWQQRLGQFLYRIGDYAGALNALRRAVAGSGAAEDYYALGMCLRALDNLPAAAEALEQALRLRPDSAVWRVELALVHLERGWHGEALAELNQAVTLAPDLPDVRRARARALIAIGQIDSARADLVEALRRDARDAESYALLAETLLALGRATQALDSARRAVALQPDSPQYRRVLAQALRAGDQRAEAIEHLSAVMNDASPAQWWVELADDHMALGHVSAARTALERAIAAAPDHAEVRFRLGDVLLRLGEPIAAAEQLRTAIARRPDYAVAHARLAEALIAGASNSTDDLASAVDAARLAVALEGQCADHWRVLGTVLRAQGATDEAVEALRRAHELDPESAQAAFLLGLTLLEQEKPAAAVAPLAAAVALAPDRAAYHGYLGIAHRSMVTTIVEPDDLHAVPSSRRAALTIARRSLQQAITLDSYCARWWYELGLTEQQSAGHAPAIEAFERAIALVDNQTASITSSIYPPLPAGIERTVILRSRALSLYLVGRLDEARADLETLIARAAALPSDRYLLGRILLDSGDAAAARTELTAAASDPSHAQARLFLGRACLALNEPQAAIDAIEQAAGLRPEHAPTAAALSQAYAAAGRRERAIAAAQRAVRLDSSAGEHHHLLATLYATSGRLQEARAALINALTLQPDVAAWHAHMGDICQRIGMIDAARSAYARAVQLAPDHADYRYALARLLRQQGRIDEARQVFEKALQHEPHQGAWHYELAELLRQQRDPAAIEHYAAALQLAPDEPRHWMGMFEALLERNERDAAQETVERALLRFSDHPALQAAAGALQETQGEIERAAWHYERALERDPQNAMYCWRLGRVQLELGNLDAARELLERALDIDPNSADAHAAIARLFASENDSRAALIHSQRAAELRPDDPALQIQLAEAFAHMRRFDEARQALERAVQRAPSDPELLARYGEMALTVGLYHEALGAFERAIAQRPDEPRYHFFAGRAHRRLKQYSRAIERFRRAVKLRPGYSEAVIELSTLGPLAFVAQHLRGESDAA
ncbi:tetratricopeptide repeat protein [Roseiflexus sp.]|uniref:tetratricopeptide repeat protein n=1 Tax=Roseiflexus sp. TaxID=2562120 RepID=UPI00398B2449